MNVFIEPECFGNRQRHKVTSATMTTALAAGNFNSIFVVLVDNDIGDSSRDRTRKRDNVRQLNPAVRDIDTKAQSFVEDVQLEIDNLHTVGATS